MTDAALLNEYEAAFAAHREATQAATRAVEEADKASLRLTAAQEAIRKDSEEAMAARRLRVKDGEIE